MAQTGFTPIQLYSSSTPTNAPSAGNLTNDTKGSELAINIADKNLFFKDSTNAVNTVPIRQSGAASDGWLSSTDWNTFNNKQPAGAYVTSVTGTAPVVSSGGTTPAISMAAATTSVNGYLTSTDWNTFNGKQAALVSGTNIKTVSGTTLLGSGDLGTIGVGYGGTGTSTAFTTGSVVFAGASGVYSQNNSNLFWDNSNGRLGIGTATPATPITVYRGAAANTYVRVQNTLADVDLGVDGGGTAVLWNNASTRMAFGVVNEVMRLYASGGVSIGNTTDPGATNLSVTGSISSGSRAITKASMPTGSILQVVQTATSIFTSTTSATFASTGLSAAITPTSSTSKILVLVMANYYGTGYQTQATIYRDSTNLAGANGMLMLNSSGFWSPLHMSYLDSPATTSSTTYAVYWRTTTGSTNYFGGDGSQTITITLLEVAA